MAEQKRILCVDDEPLVLEGLERTLFEDGAAGHFGTTPLHGVVRKAVFDREAGR